MSLNEVLTRPERAARQIAKIVRATAPGAHLGTKAVVRQVCGVSAGTFNEALRLAQARGLVEVRPGPGGGLFAATQSPLVRLGNSVLALDSDETSVADAIRIRDALDPLIISDAAWHSSPAEVAGYWAELDSMAAAMARSDASAFIAANWRLHAMLAQVNPSPMLCAIYLGLLEVIRSHTSGIDAAEGHRVDELMTDRLRVHVDLVQAIADRNPRRLCDAIAEHNVQQANDVPSRPAGAAWHGA